MRMTQAVKDAHSAQPQPFPTVILAQPFFVAA